MLKTYETDKVKVDTKYCQCDYTYEIIQNYEKEQKGNEYILIIGADNLEKFHLWNHLEDLLKHKILLLNRNNIDIEKEMKRFPNNHFIIVKDFKEINISSTEIKENQKVEYLTKEVANYIKEHHLYE